MRSKSLKSYGKAFSAHSRWEEARIKPEVDRINSVVKRQAESETEVQIHYTNNYGFN